jgi:hypothetical protein
VCVWGGVVCAPPTFQKIFSLTPRILSLDETGSERALALQTAPQPSNGIESKSKAPSALTWQHMAHLCYADQPPHTNAKPAAETTLRPPQLQRAVFASRGNFAAVSSPVNSEHLRRAESNQPCTHSEDNLIGGNNTSSAWPGKSMASLRVFASQTLTMLSLDAETSRRLSLDHAT